MRGRPVASRAWVACTVGLVALLMIVAAGCDAATTMSGDPASGGPTAATPSSAGPPASSGPAITSDPSVSLAPEAACELIQRPGPGDVPARGGETDTSDMGGGRWRVCLRVPVAASVEASAWCRWDEARTTVTEISGLAVSHGTVDYDAWLSFAAPAFEFHATDTTHGGLIANYTTDLGPVHVRLDDDGRGGITIFDVGLQPDLDTGPPTGAPARYAGTMRWHCGDAPAAA